VFQTILRAIVEEHVKKTGSNEIVKNLDDQRCQQLFGSYEEYRRDLTAALLGGTDVPSRRDNKGAGLTAFKHPGGFEQNAFMNKSRQNFRSRAARNTMNF